MQAKDKTRRQGKLLTSSRDDCFVAPTSLLAPASAAATVVAQESQRAPAIEHAKLNSLVSLLCFLTDKIRIVTPSIMTFSKIQNVLKIQMLQCAAKRARLSDRSSTSFDKCRSVSSLEKISSFFNRTEIYVT